MHYLDDMGLGDALMARLPPLERRDWRIGHFRRAVPEGYYETLASGHNSIADHNLAAYYDRLRTIISGESWSSSRLRDVLYFNLGVYNSLMDVEYYRNPRKQRFIPAANLDRFLESYVAEPPVLSRKKPDPY